MIMESNMSSRLHIHRKKMEQPRGRIGHSLRWQGHCLMSTRFPILFGWRPSIPLVTLSTDCIFIDFTRRHRMSFSPVTNQISHTFMSLVANVIFSIRKVEFLNLLLRSMKVLCLVMHQMRRHTVFSTRPPGLLRSRVM